MPQITKTEELDAWLDALSDERAKARITIRIQRLEAGNPGDSKSVGSGVVEMRITYGPGYRVYYVERANKEIVILLCGGDKTTQDRDIARAKAMAAQVE